MFHSPLTNQNITVMKKGYLLYISGTLNFAYKFHSKRKTKAIAKAGLSRRLKQTYCTNLTIQSVSITNF